MVSFNMVAEQTAEFDQRCNVPLQNTPVKCPWTEGLVVQFLGFQHAEVSLYV